MRKVTGKLGRGLAAATLLIALSTDRVPAAGFQSVEQGTWDLGRAGVGSMSAADSAATAYWNPAAMVKLERPEITVGSMGILVSSEFDVDPATSAAFGGGDGGNAGSNALVPSGPFIVYPVNEKAALGFSLTAPFVGTLDYRDSWAGRYMIRKLEFATYRAAPAAAYQVTDWLALGGALGINYTKLDIKVAVFDGSPGDGSLHIHSADEWAVNFTLSALIEPFEGTRIGLSYISELDNSDMSGDFNLSTTGFAFSTDLDVELTLPQALVASLRQQVTDELVVFVDVAWADFSAFDAITLDLSGGGGGKLSTNFRDTYGYGLAAEYDVAPAWTLLAGWSYASSPVRTKHRNPSLPFDRQIRYAAGVRHELREDIKVAFSYEYLDLGKARINTSFLGGTLVGDYDKNYVHFFGLTLSKRF